MLVLTRMPHESIMIGDDIKLTVLEVSGQRVKIGITAPRETAVHRKEVWLKIKEQEA